MNTRVYTLGLAMLAGCATPAPYWESNFGNAVRASVAAQVADPSAVRNPNPVAGIDGRAAQAAQLHYERSFRQPSAPDAAIIQGSGK